ncbi:hypothetical protein [Streptomyces zaomyceticus]|uniref:hypothetical protein n=1 Tax=Streptomyces zaomyceticus TaxID=68286 RepID=UPI0036A64BDF
METSPDLAPESSSLKPDELSRVGQKLMEFAQGDAHAIEADLTGSRVLVALTGGGVPAPELLSRDNAEPEAGRRRDAKVRDVVPPTLTSSVSSGRNSPAAKGGGEKSLPPPADHYSDKGESTSGARDRMSESAFAILCGIERAPQFPYESMASVLTEHASVPGRADEVHTLALAEQESASPVLEGAPTAVSALLPPSGDSTSQPTDFSTGIGPDLASLARRPPTSITVDDVVSASRVGLDEHGPIAVWLPGTPASAPAMSVEVLERLSEFVPAGSVLVFGGLAGLDGLAADHGHLITPAVLGRALERLAPGLRPVLWAEGGATIAAELSAAMGDLPVIAASGTGLPTAEPTEGRPTPDFRVYDVESPDGRKPESPLNLPALPAEASEAERTILFAADADAVKVDPMIRSIGVPKAGLPDIARLVSTIRSQVEATGQVVPEELWDALPQRLLSNYAYLLTGDSHDEQSSIARGGLVVPLGPVEVLVSLNPTEPKRVREPAYTAAGTINASYRTGAHVQGHAGVTGATRGGLGLTYGWIPGPGALQVLRVKAGVNGTANVSSRSSNRLLDAEGGHVEDTRAPSALLLYTPEWSFAVRADSERSWESIPVHSLERTVGGESLMLWVAEHYLGPQRHPQVVASGDGVTTDQIPDFYFASGLSNLPALYDSVLAALARQGLPLDIGGLLRDELLQKVWSLDAHLDDAVNETEGYEFLLHDLGRPVAQIQLHAKRLRPASRHERRVGETSDKAHIENVRTAIDGTGGSHTLGHSTAVSLSAGADVLPPAVPGLRVGATAAITGTASKSDTVSAGRAGLWVVVPRFIGHTAAYELSLGHYAVVRVRGREGAVATPPVRGRGLIRLPEPLAFDHGFTVDAEALTAPTVPDQGTLMDPVQGTFVESIVATLIGHVETAPRVVPYQPNLIRGTGRKDGLSEDVPLPRHIAKGRGIGMGLASVDRQTVNLLDRWIRKQVRRYGFVPSGNNMFSDYGKLSHGNDLDSRIDNSALLRKMVSKRGFESFWDQLHQDGMTFTLRRRRGAAGMDLDIDSARITITAAAGRKSPSYEGSNDQYALVNLAMGMETMGQAFQASRRLALSLRFTTGFGVLRGASHGAEVFMSRGVANGVTYLNNRPELLEYNGESDWFTLPTDFKVTIEFEHSGLSGMMRPGARDPEPYVLAGQSALARVPRLGGRTPGPIGEGPTPASVLDNAVIFHIDTTGSRAAASGALRAITGPGGLADPELASFTSTVMMRAHAKEIVNGQYTTDQLVDPGLLRDKHAMVDISGRLGPSQFLDATDQSFVLGIIKLWLAMTSHTTTQSVGLSLGQLDLSAGNATEEGVAVSGGLGAARTWQRNRTAAMGRTGGKELIQLGFDRVYLYGTGLDLMFTGRLEKSGKLLPTRHRSDRQQLTDRTMLYLVSEPDALEYYAQGVLPVSDEQLSEALERWASGELALAGSTVAAILTRKADAHQTLAALSPQGRQDLPSKLMARASLLANLHAVGAVRVLEEEARQAFNSVFPETPLGDPLAKSDGPRLPAYLNDARPGRTILGHSGIRDLTLDSGNSTYDVVKQLVDRIAPGLLTADTELWSGEGKLIGRMQGGLNGLQGILGKGRDQALWEDALSTGGVTFRLVNPIGWLLSDIVEVNLTDILVPAADFDDLTPHAGLENYGHAYAATSVGRSRDGGQSFTMGKADSSGDGFGGKGALTLAGGHHRGSSRAENAVSEQTVYDWHGHYRLRLRHQLTVSARRISMGSRPLNDALAARYRNLVRRSAPEQIVETGSIDLAIPQSIAEALPLFGPWPPASAIPVPQLPGDAAVLGVVMDGALPAARRLLASALGPQANSATTRSNLTLDVMLSRSHLTNQIRNAVAGSRYRLADNVFLPGAPSDRVSLWLEGEFYDLELLAHVKGAGAGRYSKHQSGTTAFNSSNHWRPTVTASASGSGEPSAKHSLSGETPLSRTTAAQQSQASTENYRREQHVKHQGDMYLVRVRGRFTIVAEHFKHWWLSDPKPVGSHRSDQVVGDVFLEMGQEQAEELRAAMTAAAGPEGTPSSVARPRPEGATEHDLGTLLTEAAALGVPVTRISYALADRIRDAGAVPPTLKLSLDAGALSVEALRVAVEWAIPTMRTGLDTVSPTTISDDHKALLEHRLARLQALLADSSALENAARGVQVPPYALAAADPQARPAVPAESFLWEVVRDVHQVHALRPDNLEGAPAQIPPQIAILGLDPLSTAREIAVDTGAHVVLDITNAADPHGSQRRWIDPDGRVHPQDPDSFDPLELTVTEAVHLRMLDEDARVLTGLVGIDTTELTRLYRLCWNRGENLRQAVSFEIARRMERLGAHDSRLPGLMHASIGMAMGWRTELAHQVSGQDTAERLTAALQQLNTVLVAVRALLQDDASDNPTRQGRDLADRLAALLLRPQPPAELTEAAK